MIGPGGPRMAAIGPSMGGTSYRVTAQLKE